MAKRSSAAELFKQYYSALVFSLPIKDVDFMDELLKHGLLPGDSKIKLESLTVHNERSSYFLDNVIKPGLAVGNNTGFVSLLTVMKSNKHDPTKELAKEIEKEFAVDIKYSSKPLLKDLHNFVVPRVANKWYELGIQLLNESQLPRLDEIRANYSNDHRRGCVEMLKCWLNINPGASWDDLINALRTPGLELLAIADDIEKEVKGQSSNTVKTHQLDSKTQQLDSPKKSESQSVLDHPDAYAEQFEDDDVVCAFTCLFNKLGDLFGKVNFRKLKNACIQRGTLLPSDFKQQIRAAVELDDLLDALDNPMYCNWLNIRLLKRIAKSINIQEAKCLIEAYENVVYSRKVSEVETHFHSDYFKSAHVSLVNAKIVTLFESLTVADVVKYCERLESNMGVYAGSVTATGCQPGCIQITCVIPIQCALHAYETAKSNFLRLRQFHIQYIEIDSYPKVFALNFSIQEIQSASESSQVLSHYYTSLENYMDADSVSHMMHCEHLITDDDYEAITAAPNDNKMNTLLLQYVRSMNVSQLSRFCDILKSIETHNKIIGDCSSTVFKGLLQKLLITVRVSISKYSMASSIEFMEISEINIIFHDLIDHLCLHLSATEKLSFDLIGKCSDINPLFTEQWLKKINNCKSLYLFKMYLLPFITWLDHYILKELVAASGSEDAQQLLNLFDSKISSYSSQPITSFPILSPSQLMIPLDDSEYTLLAMKFCPPSRGDSTQGMILLRDVMDIKLIMKREWKMKIHEIHSVQLAAVHTKLKLLYWMIPKSLEEMIKSNLVHYWKSGIIMMAVLPVNFHSLNVEDNSKHIFEGPFSSLNFIWQDDIEDLRSIPLQNKLVNIDTQSLAKQYFQLHDDIKEEKTARIMQLCHENSEKTSRMNILEMEIIKLKEDNKKLVKHFGQKKATSLLKQPTTSEDTLKSPKKSSKLLSQMEYSSEINIHQLMNVVPLIQEKWSLIGTRLKLSSDMLDDIWQMANEQQIPTESKNTFCCVKMLTSWYETSDDVSADAIIMAVDVPHVGLKSKISSIEAALKSEYVPMDSSVGQSVTNPPEKFEQPYFDMIAKFCLELSNSRHSISAVLIYLKVCNINSAVLEEISDFPELARSLERHKLLNKTDLSWLKTIAHYAGCRKAIEAIEEYETSLIADKIPWYSGHPKGTYLVGRTDKKPENVTIKNSSEVKSVVSRLTNIKESDSVLDSLEVGSVTFYWRIINESVGIHLTKVNHAPLIEKFKEECNEANLTHVGIMTNGNLKWTSINELDQQWLCDPSSIQFGESISEGQFSNVFKGVLITQNGEHCQLVAIKTCKPDSTEDQRHKFLQEAATMQWFNHPHIIKLLGVVMEEPSICIIMELAPFGDLRSYLISLGRQISRIQLLNYSKQLGAAMCYLETKKFVHRDIAARNVLVTAPDCIKLADFGLSRWLEESDYYIAPKGMLPIKWMAPESINFRKFTSSSDVWMFGVCVWEILMRGVKPFQGVKNIDVIDRIEMGERLKLPEECPLTLYYLLIDCWNYDPALRPSFQDIYSRLEGITDATTAMSERPKKLLPTEQPPHNGNVRNQRDQLKLPSTERLGQDHIKKRYSPLPPPPNESSNNPPSPQVNPIPPSSESPESRPVSYYSVVAADDNLDGLYSSVLNDEELEMIRRQQVSGSKLPVTVRHSTSSSDPELSNDTPPSTRPRDEVCTPRVEPPVVPRDDVMLSLTTNLVQALLQLKNKFKGATPEDYMEFIKEIGMHLRALLAKIDELLLQLPPESHNDILMAYKVVSADMKRLIDAMQQAQKFYQTDVIDEYVKQMLGAGHSLARNAKSMMDTVNIARWDAEMMEEPQVNVNGEAEEDSNHDNN